MVVEPFSAFIAEVFVLLFVGPINEIYTTNIIDMKSLTRVPEYRECATDEQSSRDHRATIVHLSPNRRINIPKTSRLSRATVELNIDI